MTVSQVYYGSWYDKEAPKTYWEDISNIASCIHESLDSRHYTISVVQSKEKFGTIRVYCSLADPDRMDDLYTKDRDAHNHRVLSAWTYHQRNPDSRAPNINPFPSKDEWVAGRLVEDGIWYRQVYFRYVSLFPHYEYAITSAADYSDLLYKTIEDYASAIQCPGYHPFYSREDVCKISGWSIEALEKLLS